MRRGDFCPPLYADFSKRDGIRRRDGMISVLPS